jgi:hypothetical protein
MVPILADLRERLERMDERMGERFDVVQTEVKGLAAVLETAPAGHAAMIGMAEMCRLLGVSRDWMYADDHMRKLGGYQNGKHGRWRFDPDRTRALFESLYGQGDDPPAAASPRPRQLPASVPLLDVKGRAA